MMIRVYLTENEDDSYVLSNATVEQLYDLEKRMLDDEISDFVIITNCKG